MPAMSSLIPSIFSSGSSSSKQKPRLKEDDLEFLSQHTACDRAQLQEHFDNFISKHPNGSITKKDFRSIMATCFPSANLNVLEKRIFNMYDTNRDGHISFKEFMMALYIMSNGTPEENLRQIFRVFDADGDGKLSRQELKRIVKDIYHMLSEGEQAEAENVATMAESAFREMDTNEDGQVSEEEFIRAVMGHEKMASRLALKIVQVFDPDQ